MPIKSYIVHPASGQLDTLISKLSKLSFCEINPATNNELLVLVTDTPTVEDEKNLLASLDQITEINNMALVSGFDV